MTVCVKIRITSYNVCYTKLLRKNKRAFFVRPLDGAWQSYKSEKNGYTVKFTFINQLDRDDINVSIRKKQAKEFIKLIENYLRNNFV